MFFTPANFDTKMMNNECHQKKRKENIVARGREWCGYKAEVT